jgi:hypothetical protein
MTRIDGLVALVADVWALAGERALVHDGTAFVEVWMAPGDRSRYAIAKESGRPLIVVGRWSVEETPRGAKRLLVASLQRDILAEAPRLAHAIASQASALPADPFAHAAPAQPLPAVDGAQPVRRAWWSIDTDERAIAAILGGAVALGLGVGIALAATLI